MSRNLAWTEAGWSDYVYWQSQDKKTLKRINKLVDNTFGKPERLKENLSGFWSRRIDDTHRMVYAVNDAHITIISCRYHYS